MKKVMREWNITNELFSDRCIARIAFFVGMDRECLLSFFSCYALYTKNREIGVIDKKAASLRQGRSWSQR